MRRTALPGLAAAALALTLAACGTATSDEVDAGGSASPQPAATSPTTSNPATSDSTGSEQDATEAAPAPGAYVTLADYENDPTAYSGTKVVYFFHAEWCPTCRATESAIDDTGIPDGLTVVKVDYDTETGLRQEYGVTQQHTFVQVDDGGAELARWTGSADGAAILDSTV
jgi:thiol-disulfide isomerase/thioredoxin